MFFTGVIFVAEADQAFSCRFCQKMYTNPNSLNRHEKLHQINEASDLKELPHKRNVFKCSCCKASFDSKSDCVAHQHDDHADVLSKSIFPTTFLLFFT